MSETAKVEQLRKQLENVTKERNAFWKFYTDEVRQKQGANLLIAEMVKGKK